MSKPEKPPLAEFNNIVDEAITHLENIINSRTPFVLISASQETGEEIITTSTGLYKENHRDAFVETLQKDFIPEQKDERTNLARLLGRLFAGVPIDEVIKDAAYTCQCAACSASRRAKPDPIADKLNKD